MATAVLVSESEYLASSYRPDRELMNGSLVERNLGEYDHSNLQGAMIAWLRSHQHEWDLRALPEQRIRISRQRYRIPDVCVISRDQKVEPVFTFPPLICIEILSKADTLRSMQDRIDDYLSAGVKNIWIVDPVARCAYVCTRDGLKEPGDRILTVLSSPIHIPLDHLFTELE